MIYSFAPLEPERLKAVQSLEKELGTPLVAMSAIEANPVNVDEEKLSKIKKLEEELGIVLLAVQ